jgi:hypothetical protein
MISQTEDKRMRQKNRRIAKRFGTWVITALLIFSFALVSPEQASARTKQAKPFRTLKIGTYDIKKLVNSELFMYTGRFDGMNEFFVKEYFQNRSQTGKRFRIRLKRGYKMKAYLYYTNSKGQEKRQRLRNNTKLKKWSLGGGEYIQIIVRKGRYTGYLNLANEAEEDDDEDYDEDWDS